MDVTDSSTTRSPAATRLLGRLVEDRATIDGPAGALAPLAALAKGRGVWRRVVTGQVVGHAAHPFLTDLPIGFWTSASLLDVAGGPGAAGAARRLVAAGLASAPAAVLTGLAEYDGLGVRQRRVAAVHASLNTASLVLYAASWAVRPRRRALGVALALGGLSVSGVSAYLGGHLAIAEKVGTTTEATVQPAAPA